LHAKAKASPDFRFYALYDKVYRKDVLAFAYERCKANGGAAGVDGQNFEDIEAYGTERWLDELAQALKSRTYQPLPVRRVHIPKPDGKQRPLGVPAIRDRVAEMAAVLVLEPIFEADLPPEQYAYRRDRSALDAVQHVHKLIKTGHGEIVDAGCGAASAPLRCAGLRSATVALRSNCDRVSGAKGPQENIGKSTEEWHFTLRESQASTRMSFPPRRQLK
jgi:hypothetical protein